MDRGAQLFELKAAGVEFGFREDDELTYALHTAELEITGDAAHLEQITSFGDKEPPMAMSRVRAPGMPTAPGYRPPHDERGRPPRSRIQSIFETDNMNIMASGNNLPVVDYLVGKQFKVILTTRSTRPHPGWNA